mmetsp:Transcript_7814/g.19141  ORF Transcript_7814/g.19141 Transcript_7814/m.19141 type:complete len:238 (-) Transcript_7814:506-1219(-)
MSNYLLRRGRRGNEGGDPLHIARGLRRLLPFLGSIRRVFCLSILCRLFLPPVRPVTSFIQNPQHTTRPVNGTVGHRHEHGCLLVVVAFVAIIVIVIIPILLEAVSRRFSVFLSFFLLLITEDEIPCEVGVVVAVEVRVAVVPVIVSVHPAPLLRILLVGYRFPPLCSGAAPRRTRVRLFARGKGVLFVVIHGVVEGACGVVDLDPERYVSLREETPARSQAWRLGKRMGGERAVLLR